MSGAAPPPFPDAAAAWHDVECASYAADLPLWRALARVSAGPVLDLGCGTGRVALDLAMRGHDVTGLDADPALVRAFEARARHAGLAARAHTLDVRSFGLGRRFGLAVAPMQVVQLLGGPDGRRAMLAAVRRHLLHGAVLAVALADPFEGTTAGESLPPLPDIREVEGWVFSSTPVALRGAPGATEIDRLRQVVSPSGELSEELVTIVLDGVVPEELEHAGEMLAYRRLERREVPPTEDYVGGTVVVLEAV